MIDFFSDKKYFIFDMDGVLINSMKYHCSAWQKACAVYGFSIPSGEIYLREGEKGSLSAEYFLEKYSPKNNSPHIIKEILAHKEKLFLNMPHATLYPYVTRILKLLLKNNCRLALVTGTSRVEMEKVLPKKTSDLFEIKITGDIVKKGKPDPEPYLLALKKLNTTKSQAIVIENAPYGIRSAKSAGLLCAALCTSLPQKHLKDADIVYKTHKDFYNTLKTTFQLKNVKF